MIVTQAVKLSDQLKKEKMMTRTMTNKKKANLKHLKAEVLGQRDGIFPRVVIETRIAVGR